MCNALKIWCAAEHLLDGSTDMPRTGLSSAVDQPILDRSSQELREGVVARRLAEQRRCERLDAVDEEVLHDILELQVRQWEEPTQFLPQKLLDEAYALCTKMPEMLQFLKR
jgi:hypothetical protein